MTLYSEIVERDNYGVKTSNPTAKRGYLFTQMENFMKRLEDEDLKREFTYIMASYVDILKMSD